MEDNEVFWSKTANGIRYSVVVEHVDDNEFRVLSRTTPMVGSGRQPTVPTGHGRVCDTAEDAYKYAEMLKQEMIYNYRLE